MIEEFAKTGRTLTRPARVAVIVAIGVVALSGVLLALGVLGFRFDPFGLAERRADRAEATAAVARDDATARGLEAAGERASAQRVDVVVRQAGAAAAATQTLSIQAWSSDDAHAPLPADRADRLRAHDGELCRIRPSLAGCPAPAADAAGGSGRLPDLPPSGSPDPG